MTWNYFRPEEVPGLDNELMAKLDQARHLAGVPFVITDGLRSGTGKQDRNAVNNSAHLSGMAVDLRCQDSRTLYKMLSALYTVGFKRVGIYFITESGKTRPTHIHVDVSVTLPQEVCWLTQEA